MGVLSAVRRALARAAAARPLPALRAIPESAPRPTPPPRQASLGVAWSDLPIETQHDLAILRGDTAPAADTILYRRQLDDLAPNLTVEDIRLSDIPGVDLEDAARVRRYSRLSSPPPPIVVFRRSDGSLGLLNGNHRRLAQAARGSDTIPAVVLSEADVSLFPGIETRRSVMANQRPPRRNGGLLSAAKREQ